MKQMNFKCVIKKNMSLQDALSSGYPFRREGEECWVDMNTRKQMRFSEEDIKSLEWEILTEVKAQTLTRQEIVDNARLYFQVSDARIQDFVDSLGFAREDN